MQALEIKKAIIKLHKTLDNKAIAEKLGVAYQSIVAYSAVLSGQGLIPKKGKVVKKKHVKVKKKESKNKPYNNIEGTAKEDIRVYKAKTISESKLTSGLMACMPFTECRSEKHIFASSPKMKFLGIDNNKNIVDIMRCTIAVEKLPMVAKTCEMSEIIYSAKRNTYSHLDLDYCGHLNTKDEEITHALDNKIVKKGGYIFITLSKDGRGNKQGRAIIDKMNKSNTTKYRTTKVTERGVRLFFDLVIQDSYKVESVESYTDTAAMIFVALKRIK
jgi:hypothetical protein|tara:strand:+ start:1094 stop:1912 length:819 start_codon:yes stop_codon:yes gene_type:complete